MLSKLWIVSALSAIALCAPTLNTNAAEVPAEMEVLSQYFNLLAAKIQTGRSMAVAATCDMSSAVMPTDCELPLPSPNNILHKS